jgi:hypothetical protein
MKYCSCYMLCLILIFHVCSYSGQGLGARDSRRLGKVYSEHPVSVQASARLKAATRKHVLMGAHE